MAKEHERGSGGALHLQLDDLFNRVMCSPDPHRLDLPEHLAAYCQLVQPRGVERMVIKNWKTKDSIDIFRPAPQDASVSPRLASFFYDEGILYQAVLSDMLERPYQASTEDGEMIDFDELHFDITATEVTQWIHLAADTIRACSSASLGSTDYDDTADLLRNHVDMDAFLALPTLEPEMFFGE